MYRASTPTFQITIPMDVSELENLYITFGQEDIEVLTKQLSDCEAEESVLYLRLSQREANLFKADKKVQIQLRYFLGDGISIPSSIKTVDCNLILNDEVVL